jgi:hypothetical protein
VDSYASLRDELGALVSTERRNASPQVSAYWRQHLANFDASDPLGRRRAGRTTFPGLASYSRVRVPRGVFTVANLAIAPRGHRGVFRSLEYGAVRAVTRRQGRHLDFDAMKHAHVLYLLRRMVGPSDATVCVIGDGFANFVAPALALPAQYRCTVSVNLAEVLLADVVLLEEAGVPAAWIRLVTDSASLRSAVNDPSVRLVLLPAASAEALRAIRIDGFVNVSSMQEMTHDTIAQYFETIRASGAWFYCCNKVSKRLPDGTIVRFDEFPWGSPRYLLGPEPCPWYARAVSGRPPFVTRFSPTMHALVAYA